MITFDRTEVHGFRAALRGMRNPLRSWARSDSDDAAVGEMDAALCLKLIGAGPEHAKFLRQIVCWVDITAPRFWWMEFDTYRFGVEKNSESTMHTITKRPFTDEDFGDAVLAGGVIADLNDIRDRWTACADEERKRALWRSLIERLPQSYMQRRTVMMSYAAIRNIRRQRRGHRLSEWHDFIAWTDTLPDSWMFEGA